MNNTFLDRKLEMEDLMLTIHFAIQLKPPLFLLIQQFFRDTQRELIVLITLTSASAIILEIQM